MSGDLERILLSILGRLAAIENELRRVQRLSEPLSEYQELAANLNRPQAWPEEADARRAELEAAFARLDLERASRAVTLPDVISDKLTE